MRFSIWPTTQQSWLEIVDVATHADSTGWDGCWVADHFMGDGTSFGSESTPTHEVLATLGALGSLTDRIELGSLVLGAGYRHPAVVANWAATMSHVTSGRIRLGLGAGWQVNEHVQYGWPLPAPGQRVVRFEEYLVAVRSLLETPSTTIDGEWYQLTKAVSEPKPVAPIPLIVGGKGDRMLGVVARHADGWNMWGLPDTIAERSSELDRRCTAIDRDPATIARSCQALVCVTSSASEANEFVARNQPRAAVAGPIEHVVDVVGAWRDVGIAEVIVPDWTLGVGVARRDLLDEMLMALRSSFA